MVLDFLQALGAASWSLVGVPELFLDFGFVFGCPRTCFLCLVSFGLLIGPKAREGCFVALTGGEIAVVADHRDTGFPGATLLLLWSS